MLVRKRFVALFVGGLGFLAISTLIGCGYEATTTEDGTVVIDRQSGDVFRVYESVLLELPKLSLEGQTTGRIVEGSQDIPGHDLEVRGRVKLLSTSVLWSLEIRPATLESQDSQEYSTELSELLRFQRIGGTWITLDLRDEDGFLVLPVEVPLNAGATSIVDEDGDTAGFMYEGSESLEYDAISEIRVVDFRWRL